MSSCFAGVSPAGDGAGVTRVAHNLRSVAAHVSADPFRAHRPGHREFRRGSAICSFCFRNCPNSTKKQSDASNTFVKFSIRQRRGKRPRATRP